MASAKLYPEANPFELRKADDLELSQIQNLFVEPSSEFLASLVGERRHQLLKGGRGAGKTITLRKLGAALSPPSHDHRVLGVYLPLDVTQFTPFEESKIGAMGAWLFESYFSGIIIQELISTLLLEQVQSRIELRLITTEQLCERILGILAYDPTVPPRSLEALLQSVADENKRLIGEVSKRLGSLRPSDFRLVFTFFKLREIGDLIAKEIRVADSPVTTFLLLDRYDDLSIFQQTIANSLFNLPPPRSLYIIAGIAPPGRSALALQNGHWLQEYQDYRIVSIERSVQFEEYSKLTDHIARKYLVAAREGAASKLNTSLSRLLDKRVDAYYAGLAKFARLSDSIIFNFLLLCESAVDHSKPISALHRGDRISVDAQMQAAKKIARIAYASISNKIAGSYGPGKHLIGELLKRFASERRGPQVLFRNIRGQPEMDMILMALRESILKEHEGEIAEADDLSVTVNRILYPYRDIPLLDAEPLELSLEELRAILAEAERGFGPKRSPQASAQTDLLYGLRIASRDFQPSTKEVGICNVRVWHVPEAEPCRRALGGVGAGVLKSYHQSGRK